jgi:prepilin-type N-terminal cleavage/methylation domain-containing protein/prepilin-type processing-associated H-X9-DG protein
MFVSPFLRLNNLKKIMKTEQRGFTLLELLSVIAVISIIATLSMAGIQTIRKKAQLAGCANNLRQLGIALDLYAQDNENCYPPTWNSSRPETWPMALVNGGYIKDTQSFYCPGDSINKVPRNFSTEASGPRSYSYCGLIMTGGDTYDPTASTNKSIITHASKQYVLCEWHATDFTWNGGDGLVAGWDIGESTVSPSHAKGGRHCLFADGHVEFRTLQEFQDPHSGWQLNDVK